jgi:carboxyl-terminal processing protease
MDPTPIDERSPSAAPSPDQDQLTAAPMAIQPMAPVPVLPVEPTRRALGTGPIYLALFVVAVMAGSALFVSGYSLGRQQTDSAGTPDALQERFQPFWDAYRKIDQEYIGEVDQKALIEGAIGGMFDALGDPYSAYMTSEEYRNSLSGISGQFEGIGAEMTSRDDAGESGCSPAGPECHLIVVRTLPDSPAQKAGLKTDDEILEVDGAAVEGKTLDETVSLVRGPRGTSVTLTVRRADDEPFEVSIVREVIETEDVLSEILGDGEVGYIRINGFSSGAAGDFKEQLTELVETKGLTKLVLDLRDDPGGFVDAAQTIASEFVGSGPVFYEQYADAEPVAEMAEPGGIATEASVELVVLVNGGTASASEIVAGAIQDTGRGTLLGETTFGKGTIQQWQTLTNDTGGFRLSVAKWLTPKQRWIHDVGLVPDVVVEQPDDLQAEEDPQLQRAIDLLLGDGVGLDLERLAA